MYFLCFLKAVYLTDEHQPDRTTSETPFFCYTHLLMKINVGATVANGPVPNLDALRTEGTDQQDAQLAPAYFDVSFLMPCHMTGGFEFCRPSALMPCCRLSEHCGHSRNCHESTPGASLLKCGVFWPVQQLTQRALNGESDRSLKFGKSSGMWLVRCPQCSHYVPAVGAGVPMLACMWHAFEAAAV